MPMDLVIEETDSLPPAPAAIAAMPPYRPGRPPLSPRSSPLANNDHASAVCADQVGPHSVYTGPLCPQYSIVTVALYVPNPSSNRYPK